jgi:FMN reductase
MKAPLKIVGIGGTTTSGSSTELALAIALRAAANEGAVVEAFSGEELSRLPHYAAGAADDNDVARRLLQSIREANGLIIASPGYHGSISGLVKNAIDYTEETVKDERVYLEGLPVGVIATAYGWQATGSTLAALRAIVHALRGWPTPMGAAIRSSKGLFVDGACQDPSVVAQLELVGRQVVEFAALRQLSLGITATSSMVTPEMIAQ